MIGWLSGELLSKQAPQLLINVNGIGYEVLAPMTTFYDLPESGSVELFTHLVVREDAHQLYGFRDESDRFLFRALIKVNGVGPKLALAVLSSIDAGTFIESVIAGDVNRLVKIPGVGKKTAERLLIEMKDRIKDLPESGSQLHNSKVMPSNNVQQSMIQEAENALVALGYKPVNAMKMINAAKNEGLGSAEELIRLALKRMV